MQKGLIDKPTEEAVGHKNAILIGALACGCVVTLFVAIQLFLPKEYRACALMPGFCKQEKPRKLGPLEAIGKGTAGTARFDLSGHL